MKIFWNTNTGQFEYLIIKSIVDVPVPVYLSSNNSETWNVESVSFRFPTSFTFNPQEVIILLIGDPLVSSFFPVYSQKPGMRTLVTNTGRLDNAGEMIALEKPVSAGFFISEERVSYKPIAPWPAAGKGQAIRRVSLTAYSNDPINWQLSITCNDVWQVCPVPVAPPTNPPVAPPVLPPADNPTPVPAGPTPTLPPVDNPTPVPAGPTPALAPVDNSTPVLPPTDSPIDLPTPSIPFVPVPSSPVTISLKSSSGIKYPGLLFLISSLVLFLFERLLIIRK